MNLVLFDIDGTLLRTGGAGREALDAAFAEVHGWADATAGVYIAGSTDGAILRDVGARHRAAVDTDAVREVYLRELEARLVVPGRAALCPGVPELLQALRGRAEVALLTGNWRAGAALKLAACGLSDAFTWGVYADDAEVRDDLLPCARGRAAARGVEVRRAIVVGDTPADIRCARAGAGEVVAVETGFATPSELARLRPDVQVPDLRAGYGWLVPWMTSAAGSRTR